MATFVAGTLFRSSSSLPRLAFRLCLPKGSCVLALPLCRLVLGEPSLEGTTDWFMPSLSSAKGGPQSNQSIEATAHSSYVLFQRYTRNKNEPSTARFLNQDTQRYRASEIICLVVQTVLVLRSERHCLAPKEGYPGDYINDYGDLVHGGQME